jgi:hypothetical protein
VKLQVVASVIFVVAGASSLVTTATLAIASPPASPAPQGASPAPSPAPVPPRDSRVTYTYKTEITIDSIGAHRQGGGAIDEGFGTLELTFNRDGNVTGIYKSDVAPSIRIAGGRIGANDLWIALGINHFQGHFTAGGFTVTTPVTAPRNGIIFERVSADTNVHLIATFLHAVPSTP